MKYIQNATPNKVNVQIEYNDPSGRTHFGAPAKVKINFRPEQINTFENRVVHTGYEGVEDVVYDALMKDTSFVYAVKEGWLIVHDTLPEEAQTPTDALIYARQELTKAQQKIADLETQLADKGGAKLKEVKASLDATMAEKETLASQVTQLTADLGDANDKVTQLTTDLGNANDKISQLTADLEAAKKGEKL